MAYKVIDIEGIGAAYAEKLAAAGIEKVEQLLEKCATPAGRKALAEETGIPEKKCSKMVQPRRPFPCERSRPSIR